MGALRRKTVRSDKTYIMYKATLRKHVWARKAAHLTGLTEEVRITKQFGVHVLDPFMQLPHHFEHHLG